jgi:hypothetical protein
MTQYNKSTINYKPPIFPLIPETINCNHFTIHNSSRRYPTPQLDKQHIAPRCYNPLIKSTSIIQKINPNISKLKILCIGTTTNNDGAYYWEVGTAKYRSYNTTQFTNTTKGTLICNLFGIIQYTTSVSKPSV